MDAAHALIAVKLAHTVAWALLVGCIVGVPIAAVRGRFRLAVILSAVVWGEIAILAANGMTCPLTDVAKRLTDVRGDAFDIYLPGWLARWNKTLFGAVFIAGELVLLVAWLRKRRPVNARGRARDSG